MDEAFQVASLGNSWKLLLVYMLYCFSIFSQDLNLIRAVQDTEGKFGSDANIKDLNFQCNSQ